MRHFLVFLAGVSAWAYQPANQPAQAINQDYTQVSEVLGGERGYRATVPPDYATSQKRYPVIYWFHGYEPAAEIASYSKQIEAYVAEHDVIAINSGPVETTGLYPLYFPELVSQVDAKLRTIADRDHRAVSGYLAGGFFALWLGGKYPDLVSSASSFGGPTEYAVGPAAFPVEYNHDDFYGNYDGVRTRLVTESGSFLRYYLRRLNAFWSAARDGHESEDFDASEPAPELAKTFDFHLHEFARPSAAPAVFNHADVYPNFTIWGWEVASQRRLPGVTVLEGVSSTGFRSAVREWMPGGATLSEVKLSIASARAYAPGSAHAVTYLRLRDGQVKRSAVRADAQGRLNFELDGDAYQIGISAEPLVAMTGYEIADAQWATAGEPVKLQVKFTNLGGRAAPASEMRWESSDVGLAFDPPTGRLGALAPGESATVSLTVRVNDASRVCLRFAAALGAARWRLAIPTYPAATATKVFQIADGKTVEIMRRATSLAEVALGEGNGDGHAAPGESFAVLIPDGENLRTAEVFTNDACVDNSVRGSDNWSDYDHSGGSVKYSLPTIRKDCEPGHVVHMLARVVIPKAPDNQVRYLAIEFPVWWRTGEQPK